MTLDEFVRLTDAKGRGGKWRAKCPVHKSRGLTLAIYDDGDGKIGIHCHANCKRDDILTAYGLDWKALKPAKEWLPPEQYRKSMQRRAMQDEAANLRRQQGLLIFLKACDKSNTPEAWDAAMKRVDGRLAWLECQLEPDRVIKQAYERIMVRWARQNPIQAELHAERKVLESLNARKEF